MNDEEKIITEYKNVDVNNALKIVRPTLGDNAGVALYRLLRLVALEDILGRGATGASYLAGKKLGLSLQLTKLEDFLQGKEISDKLLEEAAELIPNEISPISDIRSSKEYRIHMMKIMFKRGLQESVVILKGGRS